MVFGASGVLGQAIAGEFEHGGYSVLRASRAAGRGVGWLCTEDADWVGDAWIQAGSIDAVVWAQGLNAAGSLEAGVVGKLEDLFHANVGFVVETLMPLLAAGVVGSGSRLVVLGSVWQNVARTEKLAYVTSKAAVGGLVRALAADLGVQGVQVNAVLPGVVDSEMSRTFLSPAQMADLARQTPGGVLVSAVQVARVVRFLAGPDSAGVNGQCLVVDGGWSQVREV